jgi:hypothetical protein
MTDPAQYDDAGTERDDGVDVEDVLEAFNAKDIAERPGEPPRTEGTPADDADAPPPG